MKLFILLLFPGLLVAQISGRILSGGYPDIVVKTTILQTGQTTDFDVDGYFSIKIPEKHSRYEVLIETSALKLKIFNLLPNMEINLGDIELPEFKIIEIEEFNAANEDDKKKYFPVYCYTNLLGYKDMTRFSQNYILIYCKEVPYQITQFTFDADKRIVSVDVKELIKCNIR